MSGFGASRVRKIGDCAKAKDGSGAYFIIELRLFAGKPQVRTMAAHWKAAGVW
jgi:hypothetical protein